MLAVYSAPALGAGGRRFESCHLDIEGFLVGDYGFKLSQVLAIITIFPQGILPQDLKLPQGLT